MPAKLSEKIWIKKLISGRNASYIDAEKSAKEEAPVTQPLRVEYRPAALAGVAREPCGLLLGVDGVYSKL